MFAQEKTQADYDLEKMFEMLDEALTSKDERVQSALRGLLTIIALTKPQDDGSMAVERSHGPLRALQEDFKNLNRRLYNLEDQVRNQKQWPNVATQPYNPYSGQGVGGQPWTGTSYPYTVTAGGTSSGSQVAQGYGAIPQVTTQGVK